MSVIPLAFINRGEKAKIQEINGGDTFSKKMIEMGFNKGTEIEIVNNDRGPLIVAVGESRIALGRGMAQRIMVQAS
ncbi:FeoA family protein [Clostridium aestuarii]|uniref:FeoA family protein n=1 Tax=Clostridium aestuarii TaxID=338193 RepID=A0ABT4D1H0_9CLOT|nr:FeoA family protein [Clostridium aestuarii]MCY6484477.1 FeoA family protein [Clostridium aestuarii]